MNNKKKKDEAERQELIEKADMAMNYADSNESHYRDLYHKAKRLKEKAENDEITERLREDIEGVLHDSDH